MTGGRYSKCCIDTLRKRSDSTTEIQLYLNKQAVTATNTHTDVIMDSQ